MTFNGVYRLKMKIKKMKLWGGKIKFGVKIKNWGANKNTLFFNFYQIFTM